MNEHLKNLRHKIKDVPNIKTFEDLLLNLKVSDEDKDILRAIYINNKTISYIADTLGYSEGTIKRRHKRCLRLIAKSSDILNKL